MADMRRRSNKPMDYGGGGDSLDLSSLRSDLNNLFHVVTLQAKKLDTLLEQQGRREPRLKVDTPGVDNTDASLLLRDTDRLTEIVTKQGAQLDWLMASLLRRNIDRLNEVVTKRGAQLDWLMTDGTIPPPDINNNPTDPSPMGEKVLSSRPDILADVLAFCPSNEFLFLAGVSKVWKEAWINTNRPRQTSVHLAASLLLGSAEWVIYDPLFKLAASRHGGMACLAAKLGNFEGLKAAVKVPRFDQVPSLELTRYAAGSGNLEMLKWLRVHVCPWDSQTTLAAAEGGHLDILQWAIAMGCRLHTDACTSAASGGHLEVVKWLSPGSQVGRDVCKAAASGGHLHVVRWCREVGCRWNERITLAAAAGGHLDVLMWTREQGCPWDRKECAEEASAGGHREVADWVLAQQP